LESYNKALSIRPNFAEVYNLKGNSLKHQGKLEEAIQCYEKAIELDSQYTNSYINKATIKQEQK
jgi:lipoprotein NlpI